MAIAKVWVRHPDGTVDGFDDLESARAVSVEGDVIAKAHQGGHLDYEVVVAGPRFIEQPRGWRPAYPPVITSRGRE